eukprot:g297.t1
MATKNDSSSTIDENTRIRAELESLREKEAARKQAAQRQLADAHALTKRLRKRVEKYKALLRKLGALELLSDDDEVDQSDDKVYSLYSSCDNSSALSQSSASTTTAELTLASLIDGTAAVCSTRFSCRPLREFPELHEKKNLLIVRFCNHIPDLLATGGADSCIRLTRYTTGEEIVVERLDSPPLSLNWHPSLPVLLVGCMDGSVRLLRPCLDACTEKSWSFTLRLHKKFVVSVAWSKNGSFCAFGSSDKQASLWKFTMPTSKAVPLENVLSEVKRFYFRDAVECLLFVTCEKQDPEFDDGKISCSEGDSNKNDGTTEVEHLLVACRGTNYLHYVPLDSLQPRRVNMNSNGDDHISFCATQVVVSPVLPSLLFVATDTGRILLFCTGTSQQLGELHGLPTPTGYLSSAVSVTRISIDPSGVFVMACNPADPTNSVFVWCLGITSEKFRVEYFKEEESSSSNNFEEIGGALHSGRLRLIAKLQGHKQLIRSLDCNGMGGSKITLATASFDKSVKLWELPLEDISM